MCNLYFIEYRFRGCNQFVTSAFTDKKSRDEYKLTVLDQGAVEIHMYEETDAQHVLRKRGMLHA